MSDQPQSFHAVLFADDRWQVMSARTFFKVAKNSEDCGTIITSFSLEELGENSQILQAHLALAENYGDDRLPYALSAMLDVVHQYGQTPESDESEIVSGELIVR